MIIAATAHNGFSPDKRIVRTAHITGRSKKEFFFNGCPGIPRCSAVYRSRQHFRTCGKGIGIIFPLFCAGQTEMILRIPILIPEPDIRFRMIRTLFLFRGGIEGTGNDRRIRIQLPDLGADLFHVFGIGNLFVFVSAAHILTDISAYRIFHDIIFIF